MSKPGLAFGLNLTKKGGLSKPKPPSSRKPMFGDDDDSDNDGIGGAEGEESGGLTIRPQETETKTETRKPKQKGIPSEPPILKAKSTPNSMCGDLSSSLSSRKNAEAAAEVDSSVYEYDNVYDSFKPKKEVKQEDVERKPKYMRNLLQAAEVRKRDALIAEEKKIARDREAEGDEFEGKEKFVTEAYKKQQEENRKLEAEEKKREEEEAKKNEGGGMAAFYRNMLDRDQQRHTESMKAAEEMAKSGEDVINNGGEEEGVDQDKADTSRAQKLNEMGASVDINEDGSVVDKRQLLKGGLNVGTKKKATVQQDPRHDPRKEKPAHHNANQFGRKQAMRERQSQMLADQLEQSMKRSLEEDEAKKEELERSSKSRKTEGEISSAKERYLARKKAAEEAKKNGTAA